MTAPLSRKKSAKPLVTIAPVVQLFREGLKRGPWPNEAHCYYLMNTINVVLNATPAEVLNADLAYRRRRATFNSMQKLIRDQLKHVPRSDLRLPGDIAATRALEDLDKALENAHSALLAPFDPLAGERQGAGWHKPARFIARRVEEALIRVGRKKVSFDKHSPLVRIVIGALVLAGEQERSPEAVAAALAASPPTKYI